MAAAVKVSSVFRKSLFKGKVAIVTGGGTGIGKAITQELLHLGCKVMIASRNIERIQKAAEEMRSTVVPNKPTNLAHMQCNIRKEDNVKDLISSTLKQFGKIDYVVNNGGGQFPSPASNISVKGWNAVIDTNLTGTFIVCREVYNQWMEQNGGVIVNIIADMWKGFPTMSHTGAARAGVDNLTKTLAIEWAPDGVRVNSVAPGSFIYSETAAANYGDSKIFHHMLDVVPVKRLGTPEEVSSCVCYLLSPAASLISGETVKVDGAASLHNTKYEIRDHNKLPAFTWKDFNPDDEDDDGPKSKL
ncbi:peroxisomal trans-2-enoyl-CoA reductase-like [Mizuhopecten yessoensis]|uniref:peroxisomal trans-2-enoyl-CoA reductase-like n=1 Tax=Mizuhopecten yessoensis TaxID=6573 RepID=UPI000B45E5B8|nr:peroxisomal trans-2-enoyl-CoA reductase-like [Mizuhopecten yessoensis]